MGQSVGTGDFRKNVLRLTVLAVLTSALLTVFAFLHERFHLTHATDAATVKLPMPAPENPYAIPSMVMNYVAFLLPLVVTLVLSARYFGAAEGSPGRRFLKALALTSTSVPLMGLQYLPWTAYQAVRTPGYLQYDDMSFLGVWIALYCVVLWFLSLSINGMLWFAQGQQQRSGGQIPMRKHTEG
ncbi:MAG: hypothetical protein ACM3ZE_13085 [Myxococcales bacterium]